MKLEYEYRVQEVRLNGEAIVEYRHPELGSITRHILLPIDRDEAAIRLKIIEQFPIERFYSNWLMQQKVKPPLPMKGKFSADFEDYFYTITDEKTRL